MNFTQSQKALNMLREIQARGGPDPRRRGAENPAVESLSSELLRREVATLYKKMKSRLLDADSAEQLVDQVIELFEEDKRRVEAACAGNPLLADLRVSWPTQHQVAVEALDESLFIYFEGSHLDGLDQCFLKVKRVLEDRVRSYARLQRVPVRQEQVA